jgi:hypothetical protein
MMKIIITQKYDGDSVNESTELYSEEGTQEQFDKLNSWDSVAYFLKDPLALVKTMKVYVDLVMIDNDGEVDYIDMKQFDSPDLQEGSFLVIIPHQSTASIVELKQELSESVVYGRYSLWEKSSSGIYKDKESLEEWLKDYVGHKAWEVIKAFNSLFS